MTRCKIALFFGVCILGGCTAARQPVYHSPGQVPYGPSKTIRQQSAPTPVETLSPPVPLDPSGTFDPSAPIDQGPAFPPSSRRGKTTRPAGYQELPPPPFTR